MGLSLARAASKLLRISDHYLAGCAAIHQSSLDADTELRPRTFLRKSLFDNASKAWYTACRF
jgi:hypothetical protein